jgi:tetratricopeptide (TPR) repeat protein
MNDRFHEFEDGLAHLAAGRDESALKSLRLAAQREPGRLAVVRALATACLLVGDALGAREAVRELTMNSPMCAEGWRLAAQLEWKLGKYDEAMAVLARGAEHLPHSVVLQKQTAVFWGARGRVEKGASSLSSETRLASELAKQDDWLDQVARDSKLLESVLNSPQSDSDQDMLKALEFKLSALLESQPYHADRQLGLARLQVKIGTMPAAILSVQRALRANPNYIEAHRLRATILGKMGEYDAAIQVLEGLISRGMDWADIHYQLAEMQNARGRNQEARSHLYSAIRLNPRFEQAKQLLERVAA